MYDNEPSTATVKNDLRDRFQVIRRFTSTVTGGQYASKEQALVKKYMKVNAQVVYNHQEAGKYENHTENALLLYMLNTWPKSWGVPYGLLSLTRKNMTVFVWFLTLIFSSIQILPNT